MDKVLSKLATFSKQLEDILNEEFETLHQQDFDQLMVITSHKQKLLNELETLEQQRLELSSTFKDFNDYLQQQTNAQNLIKQWAGIRLQLKNCREQNEINGRLLQKKQQLSSEMLGLLSGNKETTPATYEADGSQQKSGSILGDTQA